MNVGDLIEVIDDIDYDIVHAGTIRLIEQDSDIPELLWIYVRSNNEEENVNVDPRIGTYWNIVTNNSDKISYVGGYDSFRVG